MYLSHWIVSIGDWMNVWFKFLCDFRESILFHIFFPIFSSIHLETITMQYVAEENLVQWNRSLIDEKHSFYQGRISAKASRQLSSGPALFLKSFEDLLFILSFEFRRKRASELVKIAKFARVFRNNTFFLLLNFSRFNWIILILHYRVVEIVDEIQNLSSKYSASEKIVARALDLHCTYLICVIEPIAMAIFYIFLNAFLELIWNIPKK